MSKFVLKHVPEIVGHIRFYKLLIDDKCQFDEFCEEVKKYGNMTAYFAAVMRILNDVANGAPMPYKKFHPLKNSEDQYEAKKDLIRIYLIKGNNSYIIAFGSFKGDQETDIGKLNNLYSRYKNQK
jgi:hypothetical protein